MVILWENAQCVCKVSHFKSQGSIFNLIFWVKRLDYKTVRSVIFTTVSALIWAKGLIKFKQVVFAHTLGVKLVIFC